MLTPQQQQTITEFCGFNRPIANSRKLQGGDINDVYLISWEGLASFVVKINAKNRFPEMFKKEMHALEFIKDHASIGCVTPINYFEDGDFQYLLLDFIEEGKQDETFYVRFAHELSEMHKLTHQQYGWGVDNYIGSLVQNNAQKDTWQEFYATQRILPLTKMAYDNGLLNELWVRGLENFCKEIDNVFPNEQPALLHGDLWGGNYLVDAGGDAVLIDPAIYFGHREMDLGMTQMFGGFNDTFIEDYNVYSPLEKGWQQRIKYTQLYPYLVHLILFGRSYLPGVQKVAILF